MADAFGAARRVDHVDRFALRDRLVGTGRLADIAVDAEFVDLQGHGKGGRGWAKRACPSPSPSTGKVGAGMALLPASLTARPPFPRSEEHTSELQSLMRT